MVAWCDDCSRFINQYCDTCGENFGTIVCEKYACGGTMMCPICGGKNLQAKKDIKKDPYDFKGVPKEERIKGDARATIRLGDTKTNCILCGFPAELTWKFCPECGVSFKRK